MIAQALELVSRFLPEPRVIFDRNGRSPYLTRWTLFRARRARVFLHRFHRGDDELELHNHPWRWAASLILAGGYLEERRDASGAVRIRQVKPGTVNVLVADTFHRVELLSGSCWSFFVAADRVQSWGFWNRESGRFWPWREFISQLRDPGAFADAETGASS